MKTHVLCVKYKQVRGPARVSAQGKIMLQQSLVRHHRKSDPAFFRVLDHVQAMF